MWTKWDVTWIHPENWLRNIQTVYYGNYTASVWFGDWQSIWGDGRVKSDWPDTDWRSDFFRFSCFCFWPAQHLPADGHGPSERCVLRVGVADIRGRCIPADAVLLRADLHVSELRDAARSKGWSVRGPQDPRTGWHELRMHRTGDILRLHRAARLSADRRHRVQDTARVLLSDQLVRQPVPVHHTYRQFQTRRLLRGHQVSARRRGKPVGKRTRAMPLKHAKKGKLFIALPNTLPVWIWRLTDSQNTKFSYLLKVLINYNTSYKHCVMSKLYSKLVVDILVVGRLPVLVFWSIDSDHK